MFKQLLNIIKIIKPKHILKAIRSSDHAISAFKYHYRRVTDREFADFFAKQWGCSNDDIDQAYKGLSNNAPCWKEIRENLSIYPGQYGLQMTMELPSLYLIVRLTQPVIVVETGVSSGASSAYILCALHDNKKGRLYSIDLPPDNLPAGKSSGWVVPQYLRSRWSLHIGDSKELLEPSLNTIGKIDCFIHDSLHTYEHMMFEFRTAWQHLIAGGLFLSHDVGANDAFMHFMKEKGVSWTDFRVFHVLGGFIKTKP
ncbi:MAG: class I SAM-dependent methyltransferase [Candidatus Omnitrophota bacterium]